MTENTNPTPAPTDTPEPYAVLTYEESAMLMTDSIFRGRIKVAALKYADYILNEPITTPAHKTRVDWAYSTMKQPDMEATELQPPVVMTAQVQLDGTAITDAALQSSVESIVNRLF
jgi:hypothetical protein